jgi:hypothetical protein
MRVTPPYADEGSAKEGRGKLFARRGAMSGRGARMGSGRRRKRDEREMRGARPTNPVQSHESDKDGEEPNTKVLLNEVRSLGEDRLWWWWRRCTLLIVGPVADGRQCDVLARGGSRTSGRGRRDRCATRRSVRFWQRSTSSADPCCELASGAGDLVADVDELSSGGARGSAQRR